MRILSAENRPYAQNRVLEIIAEFYLYTLASRSMRAFTVSSSEVSDWLLHLQSGDTNSLCYKSKLFNDSEVVFHRYINDQSSPEWNYWFGLRGTIRVFSVGKDRKTREKLNICCLSILSVHALAGEMVWWRILWQMTVKGALSQIHRAGRDLWKSSGSPFFPRQKSTAVIPDKSLRKLLLSLKVIKSPDLP